MNPSPFTITCVQLFFFPLRHRKLFSYLWSVSLQCVLQAVLKGLFLQYRVLPLLLCCSIS